MVMEGNNNITQYTNTPWSLGKTGVFVPGSNPAVGTINWTLTVTKGTTSSHITAFGYFDLISQHASAVPIESIAVSIRQSNGTILSTNIANSTVGDAATTANVDPDLTMLGESVLNENAASDTLTFKDGTNTPFLLNAPPVSVPAMSTIRVFFVANFKGSVLSIPTGTPLYIETVVSFGGGFVFPSLATFTPVNMPAPQVANGSVTLNDTTINTTGTVTVGPFPGITTVLTLGSSFNVSLAADGGANGGTVCNTVTLTSSNTTIAVIDGNPITIPGVNLSAVDCEDIPKRPGPTPISVNVNSCTQVVTLDTSLFISPNGPVVSATFNPPSGTTFPFGTTPVAWTAVDSIGATGSGTLFVHVIDNDPPVITPVANIVVPNDPGKCTAMVTYTTTATDCNLDTITFSPASGSEFPIGTTTVTITAKDKSGNTSTSTFTVTVNDVTPPVLTMSNIHVNAAAGACDAVVTFNATAQDCSAVTIIYSLNPSFTPTITSGATFPIGTTQVYVKATDAAGNEATGMFTVTVADVTGPTITAPNITTNVGSGACDAQVTFTATATDCSAVSTIYSLNADFSSPIGPGGTFPVGTTTVYVKATDIHGNSSTASFTVTVVDNQAPVITVSNISTNVAPGTCAANVTFNATATDCSAVTLIYSLNPSFTPPISSGASFPIGVTTVYVKATDAHGNSSTGSFTVTVIDNQPPVITAPNITTAAAAGTCGANITFNATASDCSGATLIYSLNATFTPTIASGANFPVGTTTVHVKATDAHGNSSTATFTVTVQDTQPPTITSPLNNLTIQPDNGQCYATFTYTPTAADNCAGTITMTVSPASGTQFPAGTTTTVTVTATDSAGNVTTRTFTVTVGVCLGKLGNYVWKDLDNDGHQDAGEPGVDGVKVTLFTSAGVQVGAPTFTAGGGFYLFDNLVPGDYYVIFDKTTLPAGWTFTSQNVAGSDATDSDANVTTGKSEGNATVVAGGYNDTVDAGLILATQPCPPSTFTFTGTSSGSGTAGNVRTFSVNGINVKVTAFSRTSGGTWNTAYLGIFSGGLGVTDGSEDGNSNSHTVDNVGRNNYVLFEFSQPVTIDRAFLGYVVTDSDLTAWIGNASDPYNNHLTLSDSILTAMSKEQNLTDSSSTRWADLNAGKLSGNVLVLAADVDDTSPEDYFKIGAIEICPTATPLTLHCVAAITGIVGQPYSSNLVAAGGKSPYTFSIQSGSLPGGLTLNPTTGAITGTPTATGAFTFTAKVTDSTAGTALTKTATCTITIAGQPVCPPSTFTFSGSTSVNGSAGNIRTYTVNGVTVKVSAFSRSGTSTWNTAFLGVYSGGFGVTDGSEDGSSNTHTVDNVGRHNFVLFEFSQPVVVNRAFLGYVSGDSDLTVWVGNIPGAYTTHLNLSNSVLSSLATEENLTDSSGTRWAKFNTAGVSGNVLVIAANLNDDTPDDRFKIGALDICYPTQTNPLALACPLVDSGKVGVAYSSSLRATGGTTPYQFSIYAGSLPPGLTLNTSTGLISGTPTLKGTFSYTAKLTDATGKWVKQDCCITIAPSSGNTGSIGNLVWKDVDGDGKQDAGEPGIPGITVYLKNSSGTTIATDVTDSNGTYLFDGLAAGNYTVVVNTPSGYTASPSNQGTNDAIDSDGSPESVSLPTNSSSNLTVDFGFVPSNPTPKQLTTFTQGGWGSTPNGNNPGAFLKKNFATVYPSGYVGIGTTSRYLAFTSADAICKFLPQGGTAGTLSASAVNPTTSSAGVLAGQLLALRLSVDFSTAGRTASGLGGKKVGSGPLKDKTVNEVLAIANTAIAGGGLPSGLTLSQLNDVLTNINENYVDGTTNEGYLY